MHTDFYPKNGLFLNGYTNKKGSIIFVLMASIFCLTVLGSLSSYVISQSRITTHRANQAKAEYIADSAASIAAAELNLVLREGVTFSRTAIFDKLKSDGYGYSTSGEIASKPLTNVFMATHPTIEIEINDQDELLGELTVRSEAVVATATERVEFRLKLEFNHAGLIVCTKESTGQRIGAVGVEGAIAYLWKGVDYVRLNGPLLSNGDIFKKHIDFGKSALEIPFHDESHDQKDLYNTVNQIPDYTGSNIDEQLFDYDHFKAVARAMDTLYISDGTHTGWELFTADMVAANNQNEFLKGVIYVVEENEGEFGNRVERFRFGPKGINIIGTLVLEGYLSGPPREWEVDCPININPAPLNELSNLPPLNGYYETPLYAHNNQTLLALDPSEYPSGYDPSTMYLPDIDKAPWQADMSNSSYPPFMPEQDLPAFMNFNLWVDMHDDVNISGLIYTPHHFEICSSKHAPQTAYINGAVITGSSATINNRFMNPNAVIILSYDPLVLDDLITRNGRGKELQVAYRKY